MKSLTPGLQLVKKKKNISQLWERGALNDVCQRLCSLVLALCCLISKTKIVVDSAFKTQCFVVVVVLLFESLIMEVVASDDDLFFINQDPDSNNCTVCQNVKPSL